MLENLSVVFVKWGTKYTDDHLVDLFEQIYSSIGDYIDVDFDDNIDKYKELEHLITSDEKRNSENSSDSEYSSYKDAPTITIAGEEIDIDDI